MIAKGRFISSIGSVMLGTAALLWGSVAANAISCPGVGDYVLTGLSGSSAGISCGIIGQGTSVIGTTPNAITTTYGATLIDHDSGTSSGGGEFLFSETNSNESAGEWWVDNIPPLGYTNYVIAIRADDNFISVPGDNNDPDWATFLLTNAALVACVSSASDCAWSSWDGEKSIDEFALYGYNVAVNAIPLPPAVLLFGTALVGLGLLGRRRNKKAGVAQA